MLQHYRNPSPVDDENVPGKDLYRYDFNMPRYNAPKYTSAEALYEVLHTKFPDIDRADFKIKVGLLFEILVCRL
jgi:hypothetical protein